jgi:hypothetical protein
MHTLMKIERFLFVCILLVAGSFVAMNALAGKQIFKTTDADGNVVFTDVPPRAEQPAEKVDLIAPNTFAGEEEVAVGSAATGDQWIVDPDAPDAEAELPLAPYSSLVISNPGNEANIRENTGSFSVIASLEPPLHPDHSLRLLLDDVPAASADEEAIFSLSNVDRGSHTLQAEVLDKNGAVVFAGNPSVFHLQRYSKITAPNRSAP